MFTIMIKSNILLITAQNLSLTLKQLLKTRPNA